MERDRSLQPGNAPRWLARKEVQESISAAEAYSKGSLQSGNASRPLTRKEEVGRSPTLAASFHKSPSVSVVIPTLDDAEPLAELLGEIAGAVGFEVVVVDGGSHDGTKVVCERHGARVVRSEPHRGRQMQRGAELARGDLIWFLHADSRVEPVLLDALRNAAESVVWGRFDVRLSNPSPVFEVIAWCMNQRSFLTGICTGDQGIFVSRQLLDAVDGMPDQPLLEDVEFSKRLRRLKRPKCMRERLVASSRRWEREGVVWTTLLMWSIRVRYFLGARPEDLHASYYADRSVE